VRLSAIPHHLQFFEVHCHLSKVAKASARFMVRVRQGLLVTLTYVQEGPSKQLERLRMGLRLTVC
jgi:hypothetical protein